ncbi:MAG TPA: hypothetical protein VLH85_00150, partial [Levilinea sp.]|nr:hypothetical protein [Levilinea sp.]
YVRAEDMRSAATIALGANIPPGYSSLPDTLQIALEGPPLTTGDTAGFKVRAEQRLMANWSQDEVVQLVRGKERMAAVRALQERLPLKSPPKIDIWPEWWPRLPHIPFRIQVGAQ